MQTSLQPHYSAGLVALSIVIAMLASYTALDLAGRVHAAHGRARALWLAGGALAMGTGIWSMHVVGMLALELPVPVSYGFAQLGLSLGVAIGASLIALWVSARETVLQAALLAAAVAMGLGIAGMHHVGMSGMQMPALVEYDSPRWALSLAIAVLASWAALFIVRRRHGEPSTRGKAARLAAAVVMGLVIAGMHYTGMAAARLTAMPHGASTPSGLPAQILAIVVAIAGILIIGFALVAAMLDRLVTSRIVEAQLRSERDTAEYTNRAKSEFLSNMSHELRTPLNSIIGFANILQKNKGGNLRPVDLVHLDRIAANGTHLLGVINGVLDLSKIEAGRVELEMETLDLASLIRETLNEMGSQAEGQEVVLEAEMPAELGLLYGDRARLKQILINLVGNSLKFTRRGRVTVRIVTDERNGAPARLDVIDTGIGIPEDRLETIFDAFRQADNTTERQFGGTGLGLTITRSLAELMGWTVGVRSTVGAGTTFSVYFGPDHVTATRVDAPAAGTAVANDDASPRRRFRVVVIDDEADSRLLISHEFEELGCEVLLAMSADEGIALARRVRPDLITLDVMMPGKNGLDALSEMKSDPELRDTPVVIVSVVAEESRVRALGALDVIEKPLSRDAIIRLIGRQTNESSKLMLVKDHPVRLLMVG